MVRQAVRSEAAPAHGHTTTRKSSVWKDFDYGIVPGAGAMATCKRCSSTLRASSRKHGTSHLRRHAKSSCCGKRAAKRVAPCLPAAAKWIGRDLLIEPEVDEQLDSGTSAGSPFTDGRQADGGREVAVAGDHDRRSPNCMPDTRLPQAPSSSSMRFFQKKRERSPCLASHHAEDNWVRDEAESTVAVDIPGNTAPFTGRTCSQEIEQRYPEDEVTPLSTESVEPAGTSPAQQQIHSADSVCVEAEDDSVRVEPENDLVRAEAERPVSMEALIKRGVDAARSLSPAALRSLASDGGVNLKRAFRHTTTSNTMDGSSCAWFADESSGESCYKRQKTRDGALLDEIRATYNMLVETEIRISEDDTGGAGGTVIELSYNAVSLAPDLKAAICPSAVSTKLLVPADYPQSSPVILGVEEERKGVQRVVDMAFRRGLDLLPEPRSIEGMAKAWDCIVRRAIVRFAHQLGGGTFSTRYGQWESCVPALKMETIRVRLLHGIQTSCIESRGTP